MTLKRKQIGCPKCGEIMIGHGHSRPKPIKTSALRDYKGYIMLKANRYKCKTCGLTITEDNPFAFENFNSSYQLLRNVFNYVGNLNYTLDMISKELNISPTMINNYIDSYIVIPKRELPEWLGIDEIHNPELSYKHSSYLCVLTDGENRCLYDVLGSRTKNYLTNHFSTYSLEQRKKVKYVTIDLWIGYKLVAQNNFPNCIVAADPFHYVKHLCDGFDRLRLNLQKQCEYNSNRYYLLKKWSWLLTTDDVELNNEPQYNSKFKMKMNRGDILELLLSEFPILNEGYYLKEKFRGAVKDFDYDRMSKVYDNYVNDFKNSNVREYDEFVGILENWKTEILNSFLRPYGKHKLSNALTENINGKLNDYISISHGISNLTRFRKRVLFALNPKINYSIGETLRTDKLPGKSRGKYKKIKE
ncbi:MAG: ISL3 family transposase [Bacillota bacterium]|nr:ISL3 family transposase [Bacillota bacterium]